MTDTKRDCIRCLYATRDGGCASWSCNFISIEEAEEAWKMWFGKGELKLYKEAYEQGKFDATVEQKHGRWKPFDTTWGRSIYSCTSCGEAVADVPTSNGKVLFNFCPNCGAKMDEVE